jgi:hypothetical protein
MVLEPQSTRELYAYARSSVVEHPTKTEPVLKEQKQGGRQNVIQPRAV